MCQFGRSNAPPVRASRRVKSPPFRHVTTVFVDTRLWKTTHPRKRFQNLRQSCVLSTDRIEIHQSQSLVWPSGLLYVLLAGCNWWISIRSVDNIYDWGKFWKRFRGYFVFERRVSTKTVVSNCAKKLFPRVKPFIQMHIFCNKQLATVWIKICVNCNFIDSRVICYIKTQLKYPSLSKLSYDGGSNFNKNVLFRKANFLFCHAMH